MNQIQMDLLNSFFFKLNEVYSTKKEEILSKLTDQKTGKEIVDLISSCFFLWFFLGDGYNDLIVIF